MQAEKLFMTSNISIVSLAGSAPSMVMTQWKFALAARFTFAAMILPDCAFLPVSLFVFAVSTAIGACISSRRGYAPASEEGR